MGGISDQLHILDLMRYIARGTSRAMLNDGGQYHHPNDADNHP